MEPVWWEAREKKVRGAAGILSAQADCSVDAALLLLKRQASETGRDLEDTAVAVVTREIRFYPHFSPDSIDYRDAATMAAPKPPTETVRCDWESDMEGKAWPRTVHS